MKEKLIKTYHAIGDAIFPNPSSAALANIDCSNCGGTGIVWLTEEEAKSSPLEEVPPEMIVRAAEELSDNPLTRQALRTLRKKTQKVLDIKS